MERLILVPIEPIKWRYSYQWLQWFKKDLKKLAIPFSIIGSTKESYISTGQFLDVYYTNKYKHQQLIQIIDKLQKGFNGTILFMDGWFAGVEALAYIRDNAHLKFKMVAIMHAGTWDKNDFITQNKCRYWAKDLEQSWFKIYDKILVASQYHKDLILSCNNVKNIQVVRFPVINRQRVSKQKENIVVFPHRLAKEKQPDKFDKLATYFPEYKFIKSQEVCKTKEQYYELLSKSKIAVSFALQETFGIGMIEASQYGCFPLVPNRLSYKEIFPTECIYDSFADCIKKLKKAIKAGLQIKLPYNNDCSNIIQEALK